MIIGSGTCLLILTLIWVQITTDHVNFKPSNYIAGYKNTRGKWLHNLNLNSRQNLKAEKSISWLTKSQIPNEREPYNRVEWIHQLLG